MTEPEIKSEAEPEKKSRSKKASRHDKKKDVAEASRSRKSKQARNESRSRATRTAGWSQRANRGEVAYARKAKRAEPSRSTEQITSLGIRAQSSI